MPAHSRWRRAPRARDGVALVDPQPVGDRRERLRREHEVPVANENAPAFAQELCWIVEVLNDLLAENHAKLPSFEWDGAIEIHLLKLCVEVLHARRQPR